MPTYRDTSKDLQHTPIKLYKGRLGLGFLFSSLVGLLAYCRGSLSRSGVLGAILTGSSTFGLGGWSWGLTLIYFFVSSSLLSHFKASAKATMAADKFSKGNTRDLGQVLANGGMAALLAFLSSISHRQAVRETLTAGYVGTLATANADTWATELGVLSPHAPRLITTGKVTTAGTSGGITPVGTGAAAAGALTVGLFFRLLQGRGSNYIRLPLIGLSSGLLGSLFDSYLGATVQAMYYCPHCQKETERRVHSCGTPTQALRGLPWLDNDGVNLLTTIAGGCIAMIFYIIGTSKRN